MTERIQGFRLDKEALDRALAVRGSTARRLALLSGVPENTISQARHGHRRISDRTLRRIATTLLTMPLLDGAELILGPGEPR